ncbi:hypothetical protein JFL43_21150 [Viridibacillus sp. YIM B01967]|uniref:Uncharacterized protein n=1 Tax=Viridibacillus soli TaxID=2798301 RepID=A0ABS1HCW0_9BACL|nr:hypothetical protein [Viridibacillus soli]MBK3497288.1 hypothetical protein [Viridibacillus soli]
MREFAELHNAIVHHSTSTAYVIEEPHFNTVELIEKIDSKPAKQVISGHKFTQFPVYEESQFKRLITTVVITNWIASTMTQGDITREIPILYDILQHEKNN